MQALITKLEIAQRMNTCSAFALSLYKFVTIVALSNGVVDGFQSITTLVIWIAIHSETNGLII